MPNRFQPSFAGWDYVCIVSAVRFYAELCSRSFPFTRSQSQFVSTRRRCAPSHPEFLASAHTSLPTNQLGTPESGLLARPQVNTDLRNFYHEVSASICEVMFVLPPVNVHFILILQVFHCFRFFILELLLLTPVSHISHEFSSPLPWMLSRESAHSGLSHLLNSASRIVSYSPCVSDVSVLSIRRVATSLLFSSLWPSGTSALFSFISIFCAFFFHSDVVLARIAISIVCTTS